MRRIPVLVVGVLMAVTVVACGGDSEDPTPTPEPPTATPTQEAETVTPTLEESPTATATQPAPAAEVPTLPADTEELATGMLTLSIPPGETSLVNPLDVAADAGVEAPPCAALVFATSWLVTSPDPPTGVNLGVVAILQGTESELGDGSPGGTATTGCHLLRFENRWDEPVSVELRYAVGEFES